VSIVKATEACPMTSLITFGFAPHSSHKVGEIMVPIMHTTKL